MAQKPRHVAQLVNLPMISPHLTCPTCLTRPTEGSAKDERKMSEGSPKESPRAGAAEYVLREDVNIKIIIIN